MVLITLHWPSSTQTLLNDVTVGNTEAGYSCDLAYKTGEKLVCPVHWFAELENQIRAGEGGRGRGAGGVSGGMRGGTTKTSFKSYQEVLKNSLLTDVKENLGYKTLPRTTAILTKP